MVTIEGTKFVKDGRPWVPTGMNSSSAGIKNRGGYAAYMGHVALYGIDCIRIHIPGTVSQVCDPYTCELTEECRIWIREIGAATRANGITLIPMPFPNEFSWQYHPLADRFTWLPDWWENGLDASRFLLDNLQEEIEEHWDVAFWEIINEVYARGASKTNLICGLCNHVKQIQTAPVGVSFATQELTLTEFGRQVIECSDIVNAHTYIGNPNLSWVPNEEKNEWTRMAKMVDNVYTICNTLETAANGKPFLSSEDPLYLMWGPVMDFIRGLIAKPQNKDIAKNYLDRSRAWLVGGAAMPGIMWGMAWGDYPQHILDAIREL